VVNHVDSNVFLYKLTDAPSAPRWYLDCLDENKACVPPSAIEAGRRAGTESDLTLSVSPNPFHSRTVITVGKALQGSSYKLSIFDINGKRLVTCNLKLETSNTVSLNASGLPAGVYLAKLSTANASITKRLFLMK
jgi:hypothetical protein